MCLNNFVCINQQDLWSQYNDTKSIFQWRRYSVNTVAIVRDPTVVMLR